MRRMEVMEGRWRFRTERFSSALLRVGAGL